METAPRNCSQWLEWRHYPWFRPEYDYIWHLELSFDLLNVIWGHWVWLTQCLLRSRIVHFGRLLCSKSEYVVGFPNRCAYSVLWPFRGQSVPLSQFALRRFFFGVDEVESFKIDIYHIIRSRYRNNISFCSYSSWQQACEALIALCMANTFWDIGSLAEKYQYREKLTFDLS